MSDRSAHRIGTKAAWCMQLPPLGAHAIPHLALKTGPGKHEKPWLTPLPKTAALSRVTVLPSESMTSFLVIPESVAFGR
jgi:hypothetical protein